MPLDVTPFTPVIPLAGSGASSPLSAASTASLRTAVIETSLIYATKQQDLAELFWLRIPSDADQRSEVMAITIPN